MENSLLAPPPLEGGLGGWAKKFIVCDLHVLIAIQKHQVGGVGKKVHSL